MPNDSIDSIPAVRVDNLTKTFASTLRRHRALDGFSIEFAQGEMVGLIGASGSGKSTLLRHLSGLLVGDRSSGAIEVLGRRVQSGGRLAGDIRRTRRRIGFIFQQFNLVGRLTLLQNVLIGRLPRVALWRSLLGSFSIEDQRLAMAALDRVGMAPFAAQRASTLSGGQQQRAAIARALIQGAEIIFADEPIASLDPEASRKVMQSLRDINEQDGVTVVVCLHQVEFAKRYCQRIVALEHGKLIFDGAPAALSLDILRGIYGAEADDAGIVDTTAEIDRPGSPARPTLEAMAG